MEPLLGHSDFYFKIVLRRTSCELHLLCDNTIRTSEHKIFCDHDLIISSDHKTYIFMIKVVTI